VPHWYTMLKYFSYDSHVSRMACIRSLMLLTQSAISKGRNSCYCIADSDVDIDLTAVGILIHGRFIHMPFLATGRETRAMKLITRVNPSQSTGNCICTGKQSRIQMRSNEHRIKKKILRQYDRTSRPVRNDSNTVNVFIAISLYHILDTVCI